MFCRDINIYLNKLFTLNACYKFLYFIFFYGKTHGFFEEKSIDYL